MQLIKRLQKAIYRKIKLYRIAMIDSILDNTCSTLLDIGCQDFYLYDKVKDRFQVTLADYNTTDERIRNEDIQHLSFPDKSFDIVLCQQVLEHVPDPVRAINELKRVTKRQLLISVPYEPFFTFFRFMIWEKEHFWAITPALLKHHLGNPDKEVIYFFKRYYLGVWYFDSICEQSMNA
jgi:ubiquinone/menaquinone biosynthesis C-methylase UbiE